MSAATTAFTRLTGIDHPIVQGPFGGGLSSVELLAAVSNGGGLGSFGAHVLSPQQILDVAADARASTDRPYAINLWVPHTGEPSAFTHADVERLKPYYDLLGAVPPAEVRTPDYASQLAALLEASPPVASFVMGIPDAEFLAQARARGIITIGTATTVDEAVAIEAAGMDAVVASGSDAGGHRGAFLKPVRESLVGTFSLVPQVADAVSIPVVAAGGIADSRGVAAAFALGADAVQIGTGFLATRQSAASDAHRSALRQPEARATVLTRLFSGRTARGIANGFVRDMAAHEDTVPAYPVQSALMADIRARAAQQGKADLMNLWAGQAALLARGDDAAEYLARLVSGPRPPTGT